MGFPESVITTKYKDVELFGRVSFRCQVGQKFSLKPGQVFYIYATVKNFRGVAFKLLLMLTLLLALGTTSVVRRHSNATDARRLPKFPSDAKLGKNSLCLCFRLSNWLLSRSTNE